MTAAPFFVAVASPFELECWPEAFLVPNAGGTCCCVLGGELVAGTLDTPAALSGELESVARSLDMTRKRWKRREVDGGKRWGRKKQESKPDARFLAPTQVSTCFITLVKWPPQPIPAPPLSLLPKLGLEKLWFSLA